MGSMLLRWMIVVEDSEEVRVVRNARDSLVMSRFQEEFSCMYILRYLSSIL